MKKLIKNKLIILLIIILLIVSFNFIILNFIKYNNGVDLIQLSPQTQSRMMGYIIKTKNNKVIVIDGGTKEDSANLLKYIKYYGGKVDSWFLTHPHIDHMGAFENIVQNEKVEIKNIYVTLNPLNFINKNELIRYEEAKEFYNILENENLKSKIQEVNLNEVISIDNVKIDVLGVKNPEITINSGNNSSMILKFYINNKTVLFLADTGVQSGEKLIKNQKDKLKSDYVQMAHHGQSGVSQDVYKIVNPTYCLWPTPKWLWDNDNGNGDNSGNYKTNETKSWIDKLNVKKQYIAKDGDIKIRIW